MGDLSGMPGPLYSRGEVDAAGQLLRSDAPVSGGTLTIINNWRFAHGFLLNTFQTALQRKARTVDAEALVAQRLKRLSSITDKLRRFDWLKLSEMQDIAGCRAVVDSVPQVRDLVHLYKDSCKHDLDDEDDYIEHPKKSGYRGVHLIYRYYSDKVDTYNGLKIEMQFRSKLQHAWATAVEAVGTFTRQALKSSQGDQGWLRFFQLMGTEIALREECTPIPDTPTNHNELTDELRHYNQTLVTRLQTYSLALNFLKGKTRGRHYYLLELSANRITVWEYPLADFERATGHYSELEQRIQDDPGNDAVLVSVESLESLRQAYPNYFLDTRLFLTEVYRAIGA